MALSAKLEGTITDREMVAIFELFIRDIKMAKHLCEHAQEGMVAGLG